MWGIEWFEFGVEDCDEVVVFVYIFKVFNCYIKKMNLKELLYIDELCIVFWWKSYKVM